LSVRHIVIVLKMSAYKVMQFSQDYSSEF